MENKKTKYNGIYDTFAMNVKATLYIVILIGTVFGILYITDKCSGDAPVAKEIVIEETPITIEDVRPIGELYVCSSIIEDYESMHKKERTFGLIMKEHTCAQILNMKCSYVINLEKVKYKQIEGNRVLVKLPKLEYVASAIDMSFISDDEEYWAKALPSTNNLKKKVEKKIKKQYDTPSNQEKAKRYAENSITNLLKGLGYEAEFVSTISKRKE